MARIRFPVLIALGLFIGALALSSALKDRHYLLLSLVLLCAALLPLFLRLEHRKLEPRELVLLAVLAAVAAVSRIPFAALPSVKPVSAIVILSAYVFGAEAGFLIGAVAALVSNLYFGQGPWTPWQMFAWGMVGLTAGWLRNTRWMRTRPGLLLFGFIWGFLFGWIMNIWHLIGLPDAFSLGLVVTVYAASFYFDLAHALSNVVFLSILAGGWIKVLERFRKKYGLLR
ncbi:energy-coupling factor transport system substrate-specific component [Paenibacillus sophorae]|uniref:ECF transporter S component n=1 Tax=Paenibacillus sophorae TaxID=1333845 RepID=A0A1H8T7B4_9BACL|nr:ECF transporter S component [Paenibacillus sophorae]QWU17116.1 ECF transporter S component [Paenibacillus sophorae]SEO86464.1 energy-coupling factor transport system substrate-specific component [Paenibacillus sophorae]